MYSAIQHFRSNIERVRAVGGLYEGISNLTTSAIDTTDLLRYQIVMAVSALDHYIHEVTRLGMLEVFNKERPLTDAFCSFKIPIDAYMVGLANPKEGSWFETEIREKHSYLTFQRPEKIADAIKLFSSCELWKDVASKLDMTVKDVKAHIDLIIDRRNKIAHEADLNPTYGTHWPISIVDTTNAINFIEKICETIHSEIIV